MRSVLLLALLLCPTLARAGSGPWTLSEGSWTIYGGTDYRHFAHVVGGAGSFSGEATDLPTGFRTLTVEGIASYGLLNWAEIELTVPWVDAQADRPDAAGCKDFGLEACKAVMDVGLVNARVKLRALDEVHGAPVTLSFVPLLRIGEFTHTARARLTAPTEGQTDVGAALVVGRTSGLGNGYYSTYLDAEYHHRFPNVTASGEEKIPGEEFYGQAELLVSPAGGVSFGPDVYVLKRAGVDLEDIDVSDPDRFASLAVTSIELGGKVILHSARHWSAVLGATGTVYAQNNPPDSFSMSLGLNYLALPPNDP